MMFLSIWNKTNMHVCHCMLFHEQAKHSNGFQSNKKVEKHWCRVHSPIRPEIMRKALALYNNIMTFLCMKPVHCW